jgi:hypothetical protein
MANTYKNIIITPNIGNTSDPRVQFSGGNTTVNTDINLYVYPTTNGTLSFEGSAGQLFSITNDLTGSIFAVNDVSGIPSIEVFANGEIDIAPFGGNVVVGNTAEFILSSGTGLHANGSFGTAGQILTSNGSSVYWSTGPAAATQAEQEAASSTTTYVSPGRQHFHPSAAKFWANFGVTGNLLAGYNTTSITDNGPGVATVVIATDFGTADYCVGVSIENLDATIDSIADGQMAMISNGLHAAGSVQVLCKNDDGTAAADPASWSVWGFGDLL